MVTIKLNEIELTEAESINGGGFAYDVGFFLRAAFLSGGSGVGMALEYTENYRPVS